MTISKNDFKILFIELTGLGDSSLDNIINNLEQNKKTHNLKIDDIVSRNNSNDVVKVINNYKNKFLVNNTTTESENIQSGGNKNKLLTELVNKLKLKALLLEEKEKLLV
jgi:hypothetical protein